MRKLLVPAAFLFLLAAAPAKNPVKIEEWQVPWSDTRPRDPAVAPSGGKVWFVGQAGNYLATFDPATGSFAKHSVEPGTGPHNLIVGTDGAVWFAGNLKGYIGRLDPKSGNIEKVPIPDPDVRDPHTLVFDRDQSHIWFTAQEGNVVGRLTLAARKVDLVAVPTEDARPYGILVDHGGLVWAVLVGTNKIASIDPATLDLTEYTLPRAEARPRRIGLTSDGRIWYADWRGGHIGAFEPKTKKFAEWAAPGGDGSRPYGMTADGRDRIWFVETGARPNTLVGFDPKTKSFFSRTPIPSGAGSVRHMIFDAPTNAIWFGTDANTLARVRLD